MQTTANETAQQKEHKQSLLHAHRMEPTALGEDSWAGTMALELLPQLENPQPAAAAQAGGMADRPAQLRAWHGNVPSAVAVSPLA